MIIYKDILQKLKSAGYTTTRIRKEKIFTESTLTRIRNNQTITTDTLDRICDLTGFDICDLIEYKKGE